MITRETEIRKLRPAEFYGLAKTLSSDSWKFLMGIIPKSDTDNTPLFTSEHVSMIECAAKKQSRCPAEIFLDEWGTWGRKRPTLKTLIDLSINAELFRTADYLTVQILKELPPARPHLGPAAPIDIPEDFIDQLNAGNIPETFNYLICDQTTAEAGYMLDNSYPSGDLPDFDQINVALKVEVGAIEVNYSEPMMKNEENRLIDKTDQLNQPIFDLIKFSNNNNNDVNEALIAAKNLSNDIIGNNKSINLIEFSTDRIKDVEYGLEQSISLLPNLEALKLDSPVQKLEGRTEITRKLVNAGSFKLPDELQSSELPLCIQNVAKKVLDRGVEQQLDSNYSAISASSQNNLATNSTKIGNSNKDSQLVADNNSLSESIISPVIFNPANCSGLINSQELPLTVLELSKR